MKRGKRQSRINIHFTNRWLYTFIAIGILAAVGVGIYAATYSASGGGHPYTEISTCGANQILKMNSAGNAWTCANSATSNYFYNYTTQNGVFDTLAPFIPNAGNKIPVNGGGVVGTYIWVFSYAERINATAINLMGSRSSFSEVTIGASALPINDGNANSMAVSITW